LAWRGPQLGEFFSFPLEVLSFVFGVMTVAPAGISSQDL
jgi:hypothetical protein